VKINLTRLLAIIYKPEDKGTTDASYMQSYDDNTSTESAYSFELEE